MNSVSNEELKEEFLNNWSMSVKIAKSLKEEKEQLLVTFSDDVNEEILDSLVDYISKEERVSIKDATSSFMLRNIGMRVLNLDIVIYKYYNLIICKYYIH